MRYRVMEIFDSVQGEGSWLGYAVTFVRLAGCNLTCDFCDTKESWNTRGLPKMTPKEIVDQCRYRHVVITGGEPCIQNLVPLLEELHDDNHIAAIETNGTLPVPMHVDWVVVSPKPPNYTVHKDCVYDEVKVVVTEETSEMDLLRLADTAVDMVDDGRRIWLQPDGYNLEDMSKKAYDLAMKYPDIFRVGIQMHKIFNFK